jgi:hypothetical protein
MINDHRLHRLHRFCDCITITITQISQNPNLCNRAYAAGDKNLCNL